MDNIETITNSATTACESEEMLTQFCQLMDLEVDTSKSYCWSTTAQGRQIIREHERNSKLYARDLGGTHELWETANQSHHHTET